MTLRLIKLAFAAMITTIAAVSPESEQVTAAVLDSPAMTYSPAAAIELHSGMPTLLALASTLSG